MTIKVNQEELMHNLIYVYEYYISENKKAYEIGVQKAKDLDGAWTGAFLLKPILEDAIGGLRFMYLEPKLKKEEAKRILNSLKNEIA